MKRILLVAALAVAAPMPSAWAAGCMDNPKPAIKALQKELKKQKTILKEEAFRKADNAIAAAKMATRMGNADAACKKLDEAKAIMHTKAG